MTNHPSIWSCEFLVRSFGLIFAALPPHSAVRLRLRRLMSSHSLSMKERLPVRGALPHRVAAEPLIKQQLAGKNLSLTTASLIKFN
jgi:hypothetical protein